jgi:hypothetical protein
MKMEQTVCSETSAFKIQTPGNYPEESIRHSEHGESLKSRKIFLHDPQFNEIQYDNLQPYAKCSPEEKRGVMPNLVAVAYPGIFFERWGGSSQEFF